MNKIGSIYIIILIIAVLGTSGCISISGGNTPKNITQNKSYSGYNVSFNYPGNFDLHIEPNDPNGNVMISASKGSFFNPVEFQVTIAPNIYKSDQAAIDEKRKIPIMDWTRISTDTLIIDNTTAYDDVYKGRGFPFVQTMRIHKIIFVKNDNIYEMILQAPDNEFNKEKPNFDMILNSFQAQ